MEFEIKSLKSFLSHRGESDIVLINSVRTCQKPYRPMNGHIVTLFMLDALALSVIATATWLGGWLGGCLSQPVLYQND